jgi:hypothetical protein
MNPNHIAIKSLLSSIEPLALASEEKALPILLQTITQLAGAMTNTTIQKASLAVSEVVSKPTKPVKNASTLRGSGIRFGEAVLVPTEEDRRIVSEAVKMVGWKKFSQSVPCSRMTAQRVEEGLGVTKSSLQKITGAARKLTTPRLNEENELAEIIFTRSSILKLKSNSEIAQSAGVSLPELENALNLGFPSEKLLEWATAPLDTEIIMGHSLEQHQHSTRYQA